MKDKQLFLVQVTESDYDEYYDRSVFVTENEETAKAYCEKHNRIILDWQYRLGQYLPSSDKVRPYKMPEWAEKRYNAIRKMDCCHYEPIQMR